MDENRPKRDSVDSIPINGRKWEKNEPIICYREVTMGQDSQNRVDAAFDLLFEAVLEGKVLGSIAPEVPTKAN